MAKDGTPTVTLSQIAELAGVRPSAVSNWRKRFADFPLPADTASGGHDVFALTEVEAWLQTHQRLNPARTVERLLFEARSLVRGRGAADDGIQMVATAIALADALDSLDIGDHRASVSTHIHRVEQRSNLEGAFEPLSELDEPTAARLLSLVQEIEREKRPEAFESVLRRRTRFTETRTSDELTSLLAQLADGASSVLDPAAGEGGILAAAWEAAQNAGRRPQLYGQEISKAAWRIAKQRSFIRQIEVELELGDSLTSDRYPDLRVAAVLCDPPYGAPNPFSRDLNATSRWSFGALQAKTADYLWLEHAIEHLDDKGRAYVLLPAGTLFRRGREAQLRSELIRRGAVDAIVSLPPGSAQHTTIPLALWIVRSPGVTADTPIMLVDGSVREGPERLTLDATFIERIVRIVHHWHATGGVEESDRDIAAAVPVLELLGTDANLQPNRWVHQDAPVDLAQRDRDIDRAVRRLREARNMLAHGRINIAKLEISAPTSWIPVRELVARGFAEVVRGVRVKPEDCLPEGTRVLRTRDIREEILDHEPCFVVPDEMKPRPTLTQPGDVVVSPASGKLRAIVDVRGGHVLASPLQALRFSRAWLDPQVAAAFLESPRNRRFAKGANWGYARVDLRDLELPLLPPEEARRIGGALDQLDATERQANELAERARAAREVMLGLVGQSRGDTWT